MELIKLMSRSKIHASKNNAPLKVSILVISIILLLLAGLYVWQSLTYKNRFLPQTTIGDLNVSGLTVKEANKKLTDEYSDLSFTITNQNETLQTIKKTEFGFQPDFATELTKWQTKQNSWAWPLSYFSKTKHTLAQAAFDEAQLDARSEALQAELTTWSQQQTQTKNATLTRNDTGFSITPEVNGNSIDVTKAMDAIKQAVLDGKSTVDLAGFVEKPTILSTDEALQKELATIEKVTNIEAYYKINGQTLQIPNDLIAQWVVYEDNHVNLDRTKVQQYVSELGANYNTSSNGSTFQSSLRGEVHIPAGTLSWTISTESETDALIADILAGEAFTRSPIAQGSASTSTPLIGNTYIEVDLVNQHMWYYQDGSLALETDVVTGKPTTPTPPGVFYVWNKARDEVLRGFNDDGTKYASPVKYWVPIDWTGVGIHDSDWQSAYGGQLWQTVGSHGCINTPPSVMAKLFDMIEVGTPVLVF